MYASKHFLGFHGWLFDLNDIWALRIDNPGLSDKGEGVYESSIVKRTPNLECNRKRLSDNGADYFVGVLNELFLDAAKWRKHVAMMKDEANTSINKKEGE